MDELYWLHGTALEPMVVFLGGTASKRKLRLFALACCRRVWGSLSEERGWRAIEVAERFADRQATNEERGAACKAILPGGEDLIQGNPARIAAGPARNFSVFLNACARATFAAGAAAWRSFLAARGDSAVGFYQEAQEVFRTTCAEETRRQCGLLREVFGNPFRPVTIAPAWRTPEVLALAQAAYEERRLPSAELHTDRLAVLADALEDADCRDAGLLAHFRGPGFHVRGCHMLDALLGRK